MPGNDAGRASGTTGGTTPNLRFAANLNLLYPPQVPFLERFALAAAAEFAAVEVLFPYDEGVEAIRQRARDLGLTIALFDMPPGDVAAGELGWLGDPARREAWRSTLDMALGVAERLECTRLNALAGRRLPEWTLAAQVECAVENLLWAAPRAAAGGVTLLVEPLNPIDRPTYLVHTSRAALEIIRHVDHPHVQLQYDVYHAQMSEGNLIQTLTAHLGSIGHVQIADVPGRHEPGTGEINYPAVLGRLASLGYEGYVGLEYLPAQDTASSLRWLPIDDRKRRMGI